MLILVTNDDGIYADGIHTLAKELRTIRGATAVIVAPDREQSAKSHSLTLHRPLRFFKHKKDTFAVSGTPTDCVMLGCGQILERQPDVIVSGINRGGNVGDDVHYSGTVSAAIEGGLMGIPSIAISQMGTDKFKYKIAAQFAKKLVKAVIQNKMPGDVVLNVNVPEDAKDLKFQVVKTGKRNYGDMSDERIDPRGQPYYWIGGSKYEFQNIPGSDCNAITEGQISITPLKVNMTYQGFMRKMKTWKW